jgi:hypothetical protein
MKLRYYQQKNPAIWVVLESDPITPEWKVIDCYALMFMGDKFADLNEFMKIHLDFIQDKNYTYFLPSFSNAKANPETLNEIRNMKWLNDIPKGCNHKFVPYVGAFETFDYCIHCDKKKAS